MKRRTFVLGAGVLASGSIAAIGTGAFTTLTADRDADIAVVTDSEAYLHLEPTDSYFGGDWLPYVTETDAGTIAFSFDDLDAVDGEGVATDSVYEFLGRPAAAGANTKYTSLFVARNQGSQDIRVWQPDDVNSDAEVRIILEEVTEDGDRTGNVNDLVEDQSVIVPTGEAVGLGIRIDTTDVDDPFSETVELPIRAEEYDVDSYGTQSTSGTEPASGPAPAQPE